MPFYMIEINENLSRIIDIEAEDEESTLKIAREKYKNGEIVLDSDDYVDTTFTVQ
ncbi:MAG: DpnD/PcfM family protein [Clostridia bacterium]|nr:DpnD/PcfM family protein [Clostridia bacterium]